MHAAPLLKEAGDDPSTRALCKVVWFAPSSIQDASLVSCLMPILLSGVALACSDASGGCGPTAIGEEQVYKEEAWAYASFYSLAYNHFIHSPFHSGIDRKAHQGEASKNRSRISHLALTRTFRLPARFIRLLGTHPSCKVCAFALVPLHFPVPGTTPNCCIRLMRFISNRLSLSLPSTQASHVIQGTVTCLPVGGIPRNTPWWVPRQMP